MSRSSPSRCIARCGPDFSRWASGIGGLSAGLRVRPWNNPGPDESSGRYSLQAMPASPRSHTLADFDFELPPALIAQHPAPERSASRLLDGRGPVPVDRAFRDLPGAAEPRRPARLQRHARDQGAAARRQADRRRGRGAGRARAARPRGAGAAAREQVAAAGQRRALRRRLRRAGARPRRARGVAVPPALPGRPAGAARTGTATCRCRRTSRTTTRPRTPSATRRCSPTSPARWPRRPRRCISTPRCWRRWTRAACAARR